MEKPGIKGEPFIVTFAEDWFNEYEIDNPENMIIRGKESKILRWLGIYEEYELKTIGEPELVSGGYFRYKVKIKKVSKYFLWLCYERIEYPFI